MYSTPPLDNIYFLMTRVKTKLGEVNYIYFLETNNLVI